MQTLQLPCAADALSRTRTITVAGRTVGIARPGAVIADVQARDLSGDDAILAALISRVGEDKFIPDALRAAYAGALLAECRAMTERVRTGRR